VNAEYAANYKLLKENLRDDELMVLYFEDFREDPVRMLLEVQKFLGIRSIEPQKKTLNKKVNKTKSFSLPDEWSDYMKTKLNPEKASLKELGVWSSKWQD
jgi:hypothetical protein